ncbi:MAG TPA: sugar phosphate isomerase/epimerase [Acidimicrobiia bacterium]
MPDTTHSPSAPSVAPPVALQLYSMRDAANVDFPGVLREVADMGYAGVELAGFHDRSPGEVAALLQELGLAVASAHASSGDREHFAAELDVFATVGCDTVVLPMLAPDQFAALDTIRANADHLNELGAIARDHGMTFGYHNHFWEFTELDGKPALLHLFDALDPQTVAEVDIYWAKVGGVDPAALVAEMGDRVRLLHVKDGPADEPRSSMLAVGDGVIDVAGVLAAAPSATWHIVELDRCDGDMADAVRRSCEYLVGNGLSTGRVA